MKWIKKILIKIVLTYIFDYWKGGKPMFEKIRLFLSGKKLYLVAIGMIIGALIQWAGDNDNAALIQKILEALALITGRAAIAKVAKK